MSGRRCVSISIVVLTAILVGGALQPIEGQLGRLRRAAENAAKRELERQVDRAVTGMVRCAFNDPACIEEAEKNGDPVEITDEDGNVMRDANGNPISDPEYAAASTQKPGEGAWRNYDFVPGERILFFEDYANDNVGDFPRRLEFLAGNMEVVDSDGLRMLRVVSGGSRESYFAVPLPETLPDRFTLEFPVHWAARNLYVRAYFDAGGERVPPWGGLYQHPHLAVDHRSTGIYDWQEDSPTSTQAAPEIHKGWVTIRLMADGEHVKAYVNETRVANIPQARLGRDAKIWFTVRDATDEVPVYIGAITVAAGGRDLYDRLEEEGTVATRGILFALDSDEILPESTPTLEEIGQMLQQHPDLRLGIVGHTDSQGGDDYNLDLSNRRAASVVRYLTAEYGIDGDRLESDGKGETEPVDTNDTAEGRANNRRVELHDLRERSRAEPTVQQESTAAASRPSTETSAPEADHPAGPATRAETTSGGEGEVTIVLGGESQTLPVSGGHWDPSWRDGYSEPPEANLVAFWIIASHVADPDRQAGDAVFQLKMSFHVNTLATQRGDQWVHDHRATPTDIENYVAAFDTPADSDLRFTIDGYEARDGVGYVKGSFAGTHMHDGRSLTGTFEAVLPAAPCRTRRNFEEVVGRMTATGCEFP